MLNQYLTDTYQYLHGYSSYLTNPYANRFFKPNQYLRIFVIVILVRLVILRQTLQDSLYLFFR